MTAVVIGCGNPDRGDDGVGPEVIRRLRGRVPPGVRVITCDPSRVVDEFGGSDFAVIVDACLGLGDPGSIHVLESIPPGCPAVLGHGVSVMDALELGRVLGRAPAKVRFVVVEVAHIDVGASMSGPVRRSIDTAVDAVLNELTAFCPVGVWP